ncbi:MAG: hypothetical protein K0U54_04800, partial [Bacteroidetes bacterium]|nr:hypothetical protein [Bacteroidota bacterium]
MKKIVLIISCMMFALPAISQNIDTAEVTSNSNYTRMSSVYVVSGAAENIDTSSEVIGSPYLQPNYQYGSIIKNDKVVVPRVALQYNVYNNLFKGKMTMDVNDAKAQVIIKSVDYKIKMGQRLFTLGSDNQYYEVLVAGDKNSLYKKHGKKYYEKVQATTSLTRDAPAQYKDKEAFYTMDGEGNYTELPSSKKKIIKTFKGKEADAKKIIKEQRLNISKEADLIKLFEAMKNNA